MILVIEDEGKRVLKYSGGIKEADTVLVLISSGFVGVPLKLHRHMRISASTRWVILTGGVLLLGSALARAALLGCGQKVTDELTLLGKG